MYVYVVTIYIRMTCEGIAQIYEVLEDDKGYYVVMEKAAGQGTTQI